MVTANPPRPVSRPLGGDAPESAFSVSTATALWPLTLSRAPARSTMPAATPSSESARGSSPAPATTPEIGRGAGTGTPADDSFVRDRCARRHPRDVRNLNQQRHLADGDPFPPSPPAPPAPRRKAPTTPHSDACPTPTDVSTPTPRTRPEASAPPTPPRAGSSRATSPPR